MRIKNTIKNSIYALFSYSIICVLTIIVRKVFVISLPYEYLGYEGLFSNLFAFFSLADLGIESIIVYRLYKAVAENNEQGIKLIINIYRFIYKNVFIFVLVCGIFIIPFLPYLIKQLTIDIGYLITIYLLQLILSSSSYLFSYKKIVYVAYQNEYKCQLIELISFVISCFFKLYFLFAINSYVLYLLTGIVNILISNYVIFRKVNVDYPYLKNKEKISFSVLKTLGIFKDLKQCAIQKVCGVIYGATDNLIASVMIGIQSVALLSNYILISGFITTALEKIMHPFQSAVGNLIYSQENKSFDMFLMFDRFSFYIGIVVSSIYYCSLNPLIIVWLGNSFVLSQPFLLFFALNQFIMWNHKFLVYYRGSFGSYNLDNSFIVLGAILNLFVSIILSHSMGVAGLMLGTLLGHLGFWIGRVHAVFKVLFCGRLTDYIRSQLTKLPIAVFSLFVCSYLVENIENSLFGVLLIVFISFFTSSVIWLLVSFPFKETTLLFKYLKRSLNIIFKFEV